MMDQGDSGRAPMGTGSRPSDQTPPGFGRPGVDPSREQIAQLLYGVTNGILRRQFWPGWTPRPLEEDPAALEAHYAYADAILEMMSWQPIGTAPDGREILAGTYSAGGHWRQAIVCRAEGIFWDWPYGESPSMWIEPPPPPASGIDIPKGPGSESPAEGESPAGGNAGTPSPNHQSEGA